MPFLAIFLSFFGSSNLNYLSEIEWKALNLISLFSLLYTKKFYMPLAPMKNYFWWISHIALRISNEIYILYD